jgi:predicted GIY-YIG superfamily endonuclease
MIMEKASGAAAPHALYRFFGADGTLLYVGITNNPSRRFSQHGVQREWWLEVETIRMERHPDRESVLLAEKRAIQEERPRYNVVHAGGAPLTTEAPERGRPGDYPVSIAEVVALELSPSPMGDQECPVGMVEEVSPFGVKLALYSWLSGMFGAMVGNRNFVLVPWHRVMGISWAEKMPEGQAEKLGYGRDPDIFDMDPLADVQTRWTKGHDYWRQERMRRN